MLELVVWDVQHGSAAFVKTPGGKTFVFDLGVGSYTEGGEFSPLRHLRSKYGITSVDEVVITHPHTDHLDDIWNFELVTPRVLLRPTHLSDTDVSNGNPPSDQGKVDAYLKIHHRYCVPVPAQEEPSAAANNGGVRMDFFVPQGCARSNLNNHSVVCILEYLGVKIVITGDNEQCSWNELLGQPGFVTAVSGKGLFLASHHGRDSGFSSGVFANFTPYLSLVSDGAETDTSAVSRYSAVSTGWSVHHRGSGNDEKRRCLTTRNDGPISAQVFAENGRVHLKVQID